MVKGPKKSLHGDPPNREEAEAEKRKLYLKRKVNTQENDLPATLIREKLAGLPSGVISQLPERENSKQSIRQKRKKL